MVASLATARLRRSTLLAVVGLAAALVLVLVWRSQSRKKAKHGPQSAPEPAVLGTRASPVSEKEQAALFAPGRSPWLPGWSFLGGVSLYQRNGFVEHYATAFRERRSRPIGIDRAVLPVTGDRAWLLWWPDRTPDLTRAEVLEATVAEEMPTSGSLTVGLLLASGETYLFQHNFGSVTPPAALASPPFFPVDFLTDLARAPSTFTLAREGNRLRAQLPTPLLEHLRRDGDRAVRCWFLRLAGLADTEVAFHHISILQPGGAELPGQTVTLSGSIKPWARNEAGGPGTGPEGPRVVSALLETGEMLQQPIRDDGSFTIAGVPADVPVRLSVEHGKQDYFANLGRWFLPGGNRSDLVIDVSPVFQNLDGHHPDPTLRANLLDCTSPFSDCYLPHARQVWNGYDGYPQEFEGRSFSNNLGSLDRDRFFDNPDHCFRIVHLGSSHAVASQVRPGDKYNLILEAELGVRLKRPVEVISLGRNNGDLAANFVRVRDLAMRFNPDVILLEHGSALMMQIHPQLVRRMLGLDPCHSHLDSFFYNAQGELTFRPASPDWPLHAQKADTSELVAGIPFIDTLRVPPAHMHPHGQEAFRYLGDILRYYRQQFPGQKVFLHTGLDQAQAHGKYHRTTKLADGSTIPIGVEVFLKNMDDFSAQEEVVCIQPSLPQGFNDRPDTYLTFINDGHFSPRGHQWLARELSAGLLKVLGVSQSEAAVKGEAQSSR